MKTRFKMIACLLIVVYILGMVAGCQTSPQMAMYESYVIDVSNSVASADVKIDHYPWPDPEEIDSTAKNFTSKCEFMGKEYTGTFRYAIAYPLTPVTGNHYRTSDGIRFALDRNSGRLEYISFINRDFLESEPFLEDVQDPEKTAIDIATKLAEEYIKTSDYTQTVTLDILNDGTEKELKLYEVEFIKYIQGYITRDSLSVFVTSKGNIAEFSIGHLGGFDNFDLEIDKQKVNENAIAKAKEKYANTPYTVADVVIEHQALAETQNGEIGIRSKVSVELYDREKHAHGVGLSIFTYLCDS